MTSSNWLGTKLRVFFFILYLIYSHNNPMSYFMVIIPILKVQKLRHCVVKLPRVTQLAEMIGYDPGHSGSRTEGLNHCIDIITEVKHAEYFTLSREENILFSQMAQSGLIKQKLKESEEILNL